MKPWLRRLDHLICEVPSVEDALDVFTGLGFPMAWPVGRFWPQGQTAAVALGGLNLEFLQPDERAPEVARIRTLVYEPVDLKAAAASMLTLGFDYTTVEKWEEDPALLRLRGFTDEEAASPQLICTNLYPIGRLPFEFFVCDYPPAMKQRLAPDAFPGIPAVKSIGIRVRKSVRNNDLWSELFLFEDKTGPEMMVERGRSNQSEVVEICTERGPLDLGDWPAQFLLT